MDVPPDNYAVFLCEADDLLAQVVVLRKVVRDAARADQAASDLLALLLPHLGPLLGQVEGALSGAERGRQRADVPEPPGRRPAPCSRASLLPAGVRLLRHVVQFAAAGDETALASLPLLLTGLEGLLGEVEKVLLTRN
jgi:hypothetical protein